MPEQVTVGDAQTEAERVKVGENRGADTSQEQAPRHVALAVSGCYGKRDSGVGEDGWHGSVGGTPAASASAFQSLIWRRNRCWVNSASG
jgi:hypothetical protein